MLGCGNLPDWIKRNKYSVQAMITFVFGNICQCFGVIFARNFFCGLEYL